TCATARWSCASCARPTAGRRPRGRRRRGSRRSRWRRGSDAAAKPSHEAREATSLGRWRHVLLEPVRQSSEFGQKLLGGVAGVSEEGVQVTATPGGVWGHPQLFEIPLVVPTGTARLSPVLARNQLQDSENPAFLRAGHL